MNKTIYKKTRLKIYNTILDELIKCKLDMNYSIITSKVYEYKYICSYCACIEKHYPAYISHNFRVNIYMLTELYALAPIDTYYTYNNQPTSNPTQFWFKVNDVDSRIKLLIKILYNYE